MPGRGGALDNHVIRAQSATSYCAQSRISELCYRNKSPIPKFHLGWSQLIILSTARCHISQSKLTVESFEAPNFD